MDTEFRINTLRTLRTKKNERNEKREEHRFLSEKPHLVHMTFFQIMTLFHVSYKPLLLVFQSGFISKCLMSSSQLICKKNPQIASCCAHIRLRVQNSEARK